MRWGGGAAGRWRDGNETLGCSRVIPGVILFMWEIENGEQPPNGWRCGRVSGWEGLKKQAELIMWLTELN